MKWEDLRHAQYFVQPGKALYVQTKPDVIRHFWEGLFPMFKTNAFADMNAKQFPIRVHRFYDGHDLFVDVFKTIKNHGVKEGLKHAGHIALTDFPTKEGIPIPGLSNSGLGKYLCQFGIKPKYLLWNLTDVINGSVGILCVGEGFSDIISAFSGNLEMNFSTFLDTFVEGSFQVASGIYTGCPLFVVAGAENILAGIVSAWKTYTIDIDLVPFFGATLTSTLLGFITSKYLCKNDTQQSIFKAAKSGLITGLFQLSASFGYGAAAGVAYMEYVKFLAKRDSEAVAKYMRIDKHYYERFNEILNNIEDKELRDAYIKFVSDMVKDIVSSQYSLISEDDLNLAFSAMNKQEYKLETKEIKPLTQGDFLVNYLERE